MCYNHVRESFPNLVDSYMHKGNESIATERDTMYYYYYIDKRFNALLFSVQSVVFDVRLNDSPWICGQLMTVSMFVLIENIILWIIMYYM